MNKVVFDIETKNIFQDVGKADPTLLDISVVAWYDYATDTYDCACDDELSKMWPVIEKADMLVGFNSDHFDIPLLNKYYPGELTHVKSLDLLVEIKAALGRRIRLDAIAEGTLGKNKSGHGLDAIVWYRNGEIQKIKDYCMEDVRITKEIYDYALANKKLKYREGGVSGEFPIDTSLWEQKKDTGALTFTLPF